jgi:hypothetical protein
MDDSKKAKGALTLYTVTRTGGSFHEKDFTERLIPDGILVAFITSNFGKKYHPDWQDQCEEKPPGPKKSNRGRKPKPKKPKIKKSNNGDNSQIASAITFGTIVDGHVYTMKVFRKKSGNISSCKYEDHILVSRIIDNTFMFINRYGDLNIQVNHIGLKLRNYGDNYPLDDGKVINLMLLSRLLKQHNIIEYDGVQYPIHTIFDNRESYLIIIIKVERPVVLFTYTKEGDEVTGIVKTSTEKTKVALYYVNVKPTGGIYIFGGYETCISLCLREHLYAHIPECIQTGFKTMNGNEFKKQVSDYHKNLAEGELSLL